MRVLILGLAFFLASCSSNQPKNNYRYSDHIENDFQDIERKRAAERYRRLREERYRRMREQVRKEIKRKRKRKRNYSRPAKAIQMPKIKKTNPDEQKIKIQQFISYHCIKKRLSPNDCKKVTQEVIDKCLSKYDWDEVPLTGCVRGKL